MIDHEKTEQLSTNTLSEKPDDVVYMTEEDIAGDRPEEKIAKIISDNISQNEKPDDMVNHPKHYNQGDIETIDKIKYLTKEFSGIEAVCLGNFIKYIDRCNLKGGMEDLEKAEWYLNRFLDEFYDEFHDR